MPRKACYTEKIWFCLTPALINELDAYCEENASNRSEIIRRALAEWLKARTTNAKK